MQEYRFKFYLNAVHKIIINQTSGKSHPHTWEIVIDASYDNTFVMFSIIEKDIENFLAQYQDQNLNDIPPFDKLNPTLENITMYLKDKIYKLLLAHGWILNKIEVSESPTRTFMIDLSKEKNNISIGDNYISSVHYVVNDQISEAINNTISNMSRPVANEPEQQNGSSYKHIKDFVATERKRIKKKKRTAFIVLLIASIFILSATLLFLLM